MSESERTRREATARLENYCACDILARDRARELADPFDVTLEEDRFQPMDEVTPVFFGDDEAGISVTELVIEILVRVGVTPEKPVYDGLGFTARARYEHNLSKLYDFVNMEYEDVPAEGDGAD
jgi:hypothetical protein